jgi:hypothetical protein
MSPKASAASTSLSIAAHDQKPSGLSGYGSLNALQCGARWLAETATTVHSPTTAATSGARGWRVSVSGSVASPITASTVPPTITSLVKSPVPRSW